jgi:predicted DNA-binding WGR domain protein
MKSTTLYFREGGSDKVYTAAIKPKDDGYVVTFAYGRRGNTLTTGTKTDVPVPLETATRLFDKLIASKVAKGYSPGEDGTPYQQTGSEGRDSGIRCQLLNPIEEAHGYASLIRDFDLTQETAAERVGKGRASVANSLRLLALDADIQGYIAKNILSVGHAKVLLGIEEAAQRTLCARRVIEEGLSVRATEKLVLTAKASAGAKPTTAHARKIPAQDAAAVAGIEKKLTSHLGARVAVLHTPKKGRIVIEYRGNDDLQRLLEKLGVES